jgi:hypothetical protein
VPCAPARSGTRHPRTEKKEKKKEKRERRKSRMKERQRERKAASEQKMYHHGSQADEIVRIEKAVEEQD